MDNWCVYKRYWLLADDPLQRIDTRDIGRFDYSSIKGKALFHSGI